jgi:predicted small secreted protein
MKNKIIQIMLLATVVFVLLVALLPSGCANTKTIYIKNSQLPNQTKTSVPITSKSPSTRPNTSINGMPPYAGTIENGVQYITSSMTSSSYEPITVIQGIPVVWTLVVPAGTLTGCNNGIRVTTYGISTGSGGLQVGNNVFEFNPTNTGTIQFTCWMGMIRSNIYVIAK